MRARPFALKFNCFCVLGCSLIFAALAAAQTEAITPVAGVRDHTPKLHALVGGSLITHPGAEPVTGSVLIRDGVIIAAGKEVALPAGAQQWDTSGKFIYAGLIDAYSEFSLPADAYSGPGRHWSKRITPETKVAEFYKPDAAVDAKYRSQGIAARLVAPPSGIFKGQSAVVQNGGPLGRTIVLEQAAQHVRLSVPFGLDRDEYPNSPMGAVALARQMLYDVQWYAAALAAARADKQKSPPETSRSLAALEAVRSGHALAIFDAPSEQFALRADLFAREFGLKIALRGSGREYRQLAELRAAGRPIIVPVNFPQPPHVETIAAALDVSLEELLHWDLAPENAARLAQAGIAISLTSQGLKDTGGFLSAVRLAVKRGLSPQQALAALTTAPAEMLGVEDRLGKIAVGQFANLVVSDGDLFADKTKVLETWVQGERYLIETPPRVDPRGEWTWELTGTDQRALKLTTTLSGPASKPLGAWKTAKGEPEPVKFASLMLQDRTLHFTVEGKSAGHEGIARGTAVIGGEGAALSLEGEVVWADGKAERLVGQRTKAASAEIEKATESKPDEAGKAKDAKVREQPALYPVNYPLGDFGRLEAARPAECVVFRNATLWTCGPAGKIDGGMVIVRKGKIEAVGKDLPIPSGAEVIDAKGMHLTPGIIDCHSHMATDGGINETGQAITAEVRIGDFIDASDITIYRQLAGGVTAANILHGSANPIGGQNQVVKLRWGQTGEQMKFAQAPAGIKFALGENVKQSNWGERYTKRYPQSRMGVDELIRDAFSTAKDYQRRRELAAQGKGELVRRDLELDALAEVVASERWIHCHSYRQDEILAFLRTCDAYGVRPATLQHILEGYKVADVMAQMGVGGSSFSDWWAYKFEVIDAIPYNGAVMHKAGVLVSFNSDDRELARHLNHEAAKAVKYGGVSPSDALNFVTINPAKQLRIDRWVGSLEVGKDADLVLWSGDPLSTLSRCEQTWVDGSRLFDRAEDAAQRKTQQEMRARLIQKVLASGQAQKKPGERELFEADLWPRRDNFCSHGEQAK